MFNDQIKRKALVMPTWFQIKNFYFNFTLNSKINFKRSLSFKTQYEKVESNFYLSIDFRFCAVYYKQDFWLRNKTSFIGVSSQKEFKNVICWFLLHSK